ncbi:ribonuclease H-like domain-containing protein [Tanacetum coccineum]
MTGNKSYLSNYEEIDGRFVAFGGSTKGGKITGKGKTRTGKLDFEDVYFVKELKFNLFSVSQMCDKKNNVLFTDTECVVLSPDFKLLDENQVLLRVPRKNNMYSVDLKNVIPSGGLICLFAKATLDESNLWHRRLGHINFKTMNKLVRGNLVRGLPSKIFENDHTCVACQKGKQHKASCRKPALSFMRPFGCPITILNTLDHIGKFDGKADEGFFVGYSVNRSRPEWLFDIDTLTKSMMYKPVLTGNLMVVQIQTIREKEKKDAKDAGNKDSEMPNTEEPRLNQEKDENVNSTNNINTVSSPVNAAGIEDNVVDKNIVIGCADDPNMPNLEEIVYSDDEEGVGVEADMTNLDTNIPVSPIPTTKIYKDHPVDQNH